MTFGEKIKSARKVKGLTQRQLADLIGAKHNSVSDWESNKSKPDVDTLELLCGVLDLSIDYILGTKSSEDHADVIGKVMNDIKTMDMLIDYMSLNEKDKLTICYIVSRLANNETGD